VWRSAVNSRYMARRSWIGLRERAERAQCRRGSIERARSFARPDISTGRPRKEVCSACSTWPISSTCTQSPTVVAVARFGTDEDSPPSASFLHAVVSERAERRRSQLFDVCPLLPCSGQSWFGSDHLEELLHPGWISCDGRGGRAVQGDQTCAVRVFNSSTAMSHRCARRRRHDSGRRGLRESSGVSVTRRVPAGSATVLYSSYRGRSKRTSAVRVDVR